MFFYIYSIACQENIQDNTKATTTGQKKLDVAIEKEIKNIGKQLDKKHKKNSNEDAPPLVVVDDIHHEAIFLTNTVLFLYIYPLYRAAPCCHLFPILYERLSSFYD